jgi:hypothetical protein
MKPWTCTRKRLVLLGLTATFGLGALLWLPVMAGSKSPSSNGSVPGQPFEYLQNQISELKTQLDELRQAGVPGYRKLETVFIAGTNPGSVYLGQANCPLGMKAIGGGGAAKAYLGEDEVEGIFTMVASKPQEFVCTSGGGGPYTHYGWEVHFRNDYTGLEMVWINLFTYAICAGEVIEDPGCD